MDIKEFQKQTYIQSPTFGMNYNPPYYEELFDSYGFKKLYDQTTHLPGCDQTFDGRFLFHLHWIRKPMLKTINTINRGINNRDIIKREVRKHFGIRTELEYLTGDLSLFEHDNKYRLGWHTWLNYMPPVTNEIGFMLHSFVGRDYLNIRFEDVVFIGEVGLCFKFNSR